MRDILQIFENEAETFSSDIQVRCGLVSCVTY